MAQKENPFEYYDEQVSYHKTIKISTADFVRALNSIIPQKSTIYLLWEEHDSEQQYKYFKKELTLAKVSYSNTSSSNYAYESILFNRTHFGICDYRNLEVLSFFRKIDLVFKFSNSFKQIEDRKPFQIFGVLCEENEITSDNGIPSSDEIILEYFAEPLED